MKFNHSITLTALFCLTVFTSSSDAYIEQCKNITYQLGGHVKNNKRLCVGYLVGAAVFAKYVKNVYQYRDQDYWHKWQWYEKKQENNPKFFLHPTRLKVKNIIVPVLSMVFSNYNQLLWNAIVNPNGITSDTKKKKELTALKEKHWGNILNCLELCNIDQKVTAEVAYLYTQYKKAADSQYSYINLVKFVEWSKLIQENPSLFELEQEKNNSIPIQPKDIIKHQKKTH